MEARDEALQNITQLSQQWALIEKIRNTLEKYHGTLLRFSKVSSFTEADNGNIKTVKEIARRVAENNQSLNGDGAFTWGDVYEPARESKSLWELFCGLFTGLFFTPNIERTEVENVFREDLIVPRKTLTPDSITMWVARSFIPFYDRLRRQILLPLHRGLNPHWLYRRGSKLPWLSSSRAQEQRPHHKESSVSNAISHYSGSSILRLTFIATTVVACLLPTAAITVLAMLGSKGLVLGAIAAFTAAFALRLILFGPSMSGAEVFLAIVTFSAVMVVFVQNLVGTY